MPEYIEPQIETNPEQLALDAFSHLTAKFPGWEPNDGNLETIMIEAMALLAAEVRDIASAVPTSIFRYFGGSILGVFPKNASFASAETTWTMIDADGYTIPAGTQVGIRAAGDNLIPFIVMQDHLIPPGQTTATDVLIIAVEPGDEGSGLGAAAGPVELIDTIDFVASITQEAATSGGEDAESDADYLNRLVARLTLLSPRAIVPYDFEVLAVGIPGVERALAIDNYNPYTNELQELTIDASGGTFTITFSGQTTAAIPFNAVASAVKTALENLSNINVDDVAVTGGPGGTAPYVIEFKGQFEGDNVAEITTNAASLTGGASTAAVVTSRQGSPATGNERHVTVAVVDSEGVPVSAPVKAEVDALLQSEREINFMVNIIDPTITPIDVNFDAVAYSNFDPAEVAVRAQAAVENFLSSKNWGFVNDTGDGQVLNKWVNKTVVRVNEIISLLDQVPGIDYVNEVEIRKGADPFATTDITLTGVAPLADAGTVVATMSES